MGIDQLIQDPFIAKFVTKLAQLLARDYQERASMMSPDELYEDSEFLPTYDESRDYSEKPAGYTCKSVDGTIMRLAESATTFDLGEDQKTSKPMWGYIFSKNPKYAKPYVKSELCPYNMGDCCTWEGSIYISSIDENYNSPAEMPDDWAKFSPGESFE